MHIFTKGRNVFRLPPGFDPWKGFVVEMSGLVKTGADTGSLDDYLDVAAVELCPDGVVEPGDAGCGERPAAYGYLDRVAVYLGGLRPQNNDTTTALPPDIRILVVRASGCIPEPAFEGVVQPNLPDVGGWNAGGLWVDLSGEQCDRFEVRAFIDTAAFPAASSLVVDLRIHVGMGGGPAATTQGMMVP